MVPPGPVSADMETVPEIVVSTVTTAWNASVWGVTWAGSTVGTTTTVSPEHSVCSTATV